MGKRREAHEPRITACGSRRSDGIRSADPRGGGGEPPHPAPGATKRWKHHLQPGQKQSRVRSGGAVDHRRARALPADGPSQASERGIRATRARVQRWRRAARTREAAGARCRSGKAIDPQARCGATDLVRASYRRANAHSRTRCPPPADLGQGARKPPRRFRRPAPESKPTGATAQAAGESPSLTAPSAPCLPGHAFARALTMARPQRNAPAKLGLRGRVTGVLWRRRKTPRVDRAGPALT